MNVSKYTFDQFYVGQKSSFSVNITKEMVDSFRIITGDVNPLHCDASYAKAKGYKDSVVYGLLTASFLSTLCGCFLPGETSLIQKVDVDFCRPTYVGDTLVIEGTIVRIEEVFQLLVLNVVFHNQEGETVLRGKIRVGAKE